jgi:ABC-type phosphate transport system auxiliary subunit
MPKKETIKIENEFGFTFSEEDPQDIQDNHQNDLDAVNQRLDRLYSVVEIFLNNLAANPEKKTIVWPNRAEKIEEFKAKLFAIKEGKE